MADNDRFLIIKEDENIKGIGNKGKTRAEYEDMIAESIYKVISYVSTNYDWQSVKNNSVFTEGNIYKQIICSAKAVVDRLFGEGE